MNKNHTTTLVTRLLRDDRGLTAIELAVVVAILAILAAIVANNTTGMSSNARAGTQSTDITEVQDAVSRFSADDAKGFYPTNPLSNTIGVSDTIAFTATATLSDGSHKMFWPDYLQKLPRDVTSADYITNTWFITSTGVVNDSTSPSSY